MTHFIALDILLDASNSGRSGSVAEQRIVNGIVKWHVHQTIYVSRTMGMRLMTQYGNTWISLADNSVWLSALDEKTLIDAIDGQLATV